MKDIEGPRPYLCYPFGVAETLNENHGIHSLTQLIEERSRTYHKTVIGMPYKNEQDTWTCEQYSYLDIFNGINALCHHFLSSGILPERKKADGFKSIVVALVAPSNVHMMMVMLAIQRLGLAVLLITPNQSHKVIKHLCNELRVVRVLSPLTIEGLDTTNLPEHSIWLDAIKNPGEVYHRTLTPLEEGETYGVIYHSSGTTSGLPKPLPTKHRFLVSFCAHKQTDLATLTTTPLNTGGTADVCRSMCANAPLYLFPDTVPLTAKNVCNARDASSEGLGYEVRALSCVPYVAKMLAEDKTSLKMLQRLQFLGVGGAPLPKATGDFIVNSGIPLVSRMGSSECNFLMSSYRDYENDKDWDYLRSEPGGHYFTFLPQNDGTGNCELEVNGSWPALAVKPNHEGNFRTGDLFHPHPTTAHAWLYLGRSDDTIVLGNGKKADPKALEGSLRGLTYTKDALVFGVGKNNIGVFVIESDNPADPQGDVLRRKLWDEVVQDINHQAPAHAEVYYEMIRILPSSSSFEKTPKGTIFRNGTYAKLQHEIDSAYSQTQEKLEVSDAQLEAYISDLVQKVSQKKLGEHDDLFSAGVNSLQSVRIRNTIVGQLGIDVPTNLVFEEPSIARIVSFIRQTRSGSSVESQNPLDLMQDLVTRYTFDSAATEQAPPASAAATEVLLLSGVTGGLGSHILKTIALGKHSRINKVICLVRSSNQKSPHTRMEETFRYRKIEMSETSINTEYLEADLSMPDLGLGKRFNSLKDEVTVVVHAAWPVNFNASLISFESSVSSTKTLLDFAVSAQSRFYFCSSTASVIQCSQAPIQEKLSTDPKEASPVGYAQSKWVTEQLVSSYASQIPCGIFRIGQLCSDTEAGVWSESEGWSLMFASVNVIQAMPNLAEDKIAWLPVDIAASAILDIVCESTIKSGNPKVWHIVNPQAQSSWSDILKYFKNAGYQFDIVEPKVWVEKLEQSAESADNPSRKLLGLWKSAFASGEPTKPDPIFSSAEAVFASQSLQCSDPINEALMQKTFANWKECRLLR